MQVAAIQGKNTGNGGPVQAAALQSTPLAQGISQSNWVRLEISFPLKVEFV